MMIRARWRSEVHAAQAIVVQQVQTGYGQKQRPKMMQSFGLPSFQMKLG